MMKKLIIGIITFFFLLIIGLVSAPFLFKDQLVQFVKDTANENLNAKVEFGDFDLSLISTFPDFLFEIEQVSVIGVDTFATDTLVHIGKLGFKVNIESVMSGNYTVESFEIDDLTANAIVLENGKANWDVTLPDSAVAVVDTAVSEPLKFELSSYAIRNANIVYDDRQGKMKAVIKNLNHEGVFKMDGDLMVLDTKTLMDELTYVMEDIVYMNKVKTVANAKIDLDLANSKYTFKENEFKLNELKLGIDGSFAMPGDDMDFDLKLSAKDNNFGEVLSLIPAVYKTDLAGIETKGNFDFEATLKGKMTEEDLPGFNVLLSVKDGYFKYPDLPESVNNIQVELKVDNASGIIDKTIVNLELFHFEIAKNPIDIKFFTTNLESDPVLKGDIKSKFNLEYLSKAIPMEEGVAYKGRLNADVQFNGKQSMLDNEDYEAFDAKGQITLLDFFYHSSDIPEVLIKNLYLNFTPKMVELGNLDMQLGKSDLNAKGRIDNLLSYVFTDDTLSGSFTLSSNYFNLDEWMSEDSAATATNPDSTLENTGVVEVPGNIDFVLNSSFKKIDYDNMPIDNLKGKLIVKNSQVKFEETNFGILGGKIGIDGIYSTKDPAVPKANLRLSISEMDIPTAFNTFNTVEKIAPIAKDAKGKFSTDFKYASDLTDNMDPIYETMNGGGDLFVKDLTIENNELFDQLAKLLKNPKYKKMRAENLKIKYEFKDGKLFVKPFDIKIGTSSAKVSGWTSFEGNMEYLFAFKIPRSEFGGEANAILDDLLGQAAKYGAKIEVGEFINVDVYATGPISNPKLSLKPRGSSGGESTSIQDKAKAALKAEADKLKKMAEEEAERLKKEAEERVKAEADKLKKEAEAKVKAEEERLKREAEAKLKAEEERLKREAEKKAEEEAKKQTKNILKGLGK